MYVRASVNMKFHVIMAVLVISVACLHETMCQDHATGPNANSTVIVNITENETESTTVAATEFTTTKRPEVQSVPTQPAALKNSPVLDPWFVECEGCACDITPSCEVGCCCDQSCSEEDKLAFASCENHVSGIHQRHCLRSRSIFRNSTNNTLVSTSDSLFCIIPKKPETVACHKRYEVFTTTEQFKRAAFKNEATDLSTGVVDQFWPQPKHGEQIIIAVNGEYKYLGFPGTAFGRCAGVDPILYLINRDTTCCSPMVFNASCETNPLLSAAMYYRNFSIVKGEEHIPITPCLCQPSGHCAQDVPTPVYNISTSICSNVLSQVHYKIFYNRAFGIKSIIAFILLEDIPDRGTKRLNWCPTFKVGYELADDSNTTTPECFSNHTLTKVTKSGNPGYLMGSPVLAGKWNGVAVNDSSAYSLSQPVTSSAGHCSFAKGIKFGENVRTGCTLKSNDQPNCEELGNLTSRLFNASVDRIGVFGNASPIRAEDWVPLLHRTSFKVLHAGDYVSNQFSSNCKLTVDANLVIAVARVGPKTNPQSKIVGALLTKTEVDYVTFCQQFVCDFQMNYVYVSFAITFIDVS